MNSTFFLIYIVTGNISYHKVHSKTSNTCSRRFSCLLKWSPSLSAIGRGPSIEKLTFMPTLSNDHYIYILVLCLVHNNG